MGLGKYALRLTLGFVVARARDARRSSCVDVIPGSLADRNGWSRSSIVEIGHVLSRNPQRIAFPNRAHRAFRMRPPRPVARRVQENRATRERSVRIEDHLDLRDIRVALRHAWRRRPAIEVALRQPCVERRRHRHRHARSVVVRQSLGVAAARLAWRGVAVLPCPISLAIEFGSKLRDGLSFSGVALSRVRADR